MCLWWSVWAVFYFLKCTHFLTKTDFQLLTNFLPLSRLDSFLNDATLSHTRIWSFLGDAIGPLSVLSVCNVGVLWPNGWTDQDATWSWYGGRPDPGHIVLNGDPDPQKWVQPPPPLFGPCLMPKRSPISATAELLYCTTLECWPIQHFVYCCWPDCKPEGPLFSAEVVCLCVCVCLTGTSTLQRWLILINLVTRTLLWSSLAATIMVQIGHRGTARCLFENIKKFSKITEFEFQNSGPSFFACVSLVYCKKNSTRFEQLTEEIDFEVCPYGNSGNGTAAAARRSAGYSYWTGGAAACNDRSSGAFRTGGVQNWGRNRAVKTNWLVNLAMTNSAVGCLLILVSD